MRAELSQHRNVSCADVDRFSIFGASLSWYILLSCSTHEKSIHTQDTLIMIAHNDAPLTVYSSHAPFYASLMRKIHPLYPFSVAVCYLQALTHSIYTRTHMHTPFCLFQALLSPPLKRRFVFNNNKSFLLLKCSASMPARYLTEVTHVQ